jgi:hypothetical protein
MLTLRKIGALLLIPVVVLFISPSGAIAGDGTGDVGCTSGSPTPGCDVHAGTGSDSGGAKPVAGGGRGGDGRCYKPGGAEIPCEREGGWAGGDGCYYKPVDVSASTIGALGGQPAGDGGWYLQTCFSDITNGEQSFGVPVWIVGAAPAVSPEILARQARSRLTLPAVTIRLNPSGDQLTNLPVWLALDPTSWRSQSATASVPGVSVTATARPVRAAWSMGDGSTITCTGPGTTWTPGTDPAAASPDCGHVYRKSSAATPGAAFVVSVTVTWEVSWAGAGRSGTVPGLATSGVVQVRVQEAQAVLTF